MMSKKLTRLGEVLNSLRPSQTEPKRQSPLGVNVYGYVFAASGVGQHTRLLVAALESAGIPHTVTAFTKTISPQDVEFKTSPARADLPVSIIGVNADETPHFFSETVLPPNQYKIGLWAWELEDFPSSMAESANWLDEVWANSGFSAAAITRKVSVPTHAFPLPVEDPKLGEWTRSDFGLSDDYLFMFCFDFDSVYARKNPTAIVRAFGSAFPTRKGVQLVLKTINGDRHQQRQEQLRQLVNETPGVRLLEGSIPIRKQHTLLALCDCYVSLHRSEGFGLTIAECMALGKPVIATAYSGNLDYMHHGVADLVGYRFREIGPDAAPYDSASHWAEPDVDHAALLMQRIVQNPDYGRSLGHMARTYILANHGVAQRGSWIKSRLQALAQRSDARPAAGASTTHQG